VEVTVPDRRILKFLRFLLYAALTILGIYLTLKFLLPWTAPFILAFLTAGCLEPAVKYTESRMGVKRWFTSALLTAVFISLLFLLGQFIIVGAVGGLSEFVADLPETVSGITDSLSWLGDRIYAYIDSSPVSIRGYLENALDSLLRGIQELPGELSGSILKFLSGIFSYMPKILLFIGTYTVGVFFISSNYNQVSSFLLRQIPKDRWNKFTKLKDGILTTLFKWLKAQFMLMGVTFLELTAGFIFLRIEQPLLIAIVVALIDALPVLGVGTVLIPWALLQIITGSTAMGVGLIVLYGIVTLIHSLLEPKLVGSQLGLHPVATLLAMYIGFSSIGIPGMILFPMGLIIVKRLNDDNIIRLWR